MFFRHWRGEGVFDILQGGYIDTRIIIYGVEWDFEAYYFWKERFKIIMDFIVSFAVVWDCVH